MNKQYLEICRLVLEKGEKKEDRTGVGTISYFGTQMEFDLKEGFPLLTTKKMPFRSLVKELFWFIKGETNIKYLVDNNVGFWNEWAFEKFKKSDDYQGENLKEYVEKIKNDEEFAKKHGEPGSYVGKQWRDFNGIDQLKELVENLKNNPFSRRHILTAWNPAELDKMVLPPCVITCQFDVSPDYRLSCMVNQRSGDLFLGVPINIASYSLLTKMIAQVCGYKLGKYIHVTGDTHIYLNHVEQVKLQLTRQPNAMPQLKLNQEVKSIFDFCYEDIVLENYECHEEIKAQVAV